MRMITPAISAVVAAALGSAAAFAQSSPSNTSGATAPPPASPQAASPAAKPPMTQDRVRQVMKEAGFTNVTIMDAAYLVQAMTKDGDQILVLVNAPMMNRAGASASSGTAPSGTSAATAPKQ